MKYLDYVERKTVNKLMPCGACDIERTESYLTSMAKKGLVLAYDGFFLGFATFEKYDESQQLKYRLEPLTDEKGQNYKNGEPLEEAQQLAKSMGWNYVATRGNFAVYVSKADNEVELNTDCQVQETTLKKVERFNNQRIILGLIWLFYVVYQIVGTPSLLINGFSFDIYVMRFIEWGIVPVLSLLALFTIDIMWCLCNKNTIRKMRKKLQVGEELEHDKPLKHSLYSRITVIALYVIIIILLVVSIFKGIGNSSTMSAERFKERQGQMPSSYASQLLTIDELKSYQIMDYNYVMEHSYDTPYEENNNLLAVDKISEIIMLIDKATVESEDEPNEELMENILPKVRFYVDYYELRYDFLAKPMANGMFLDSKADYRDGRTTRVQTLDTADIDVDVDYIVNYRSYMDNIIMAKGNKVIKISWHNNSNSGAGFINPNDIAKTFVKMLENN